MSTQHTEYPPRSFTDAERAAIRSRMRNSGQFPPPYYLHAFATMEDACQLGAAGYTRIARHIAHVKRDTLKEVAAEFRRVRPEGRYSVFVYCAEQSEAAAFVDSEVLDWVLENE